MQETIRATHFDPELFYDTSIMPARQGRNPYETFPMTTEPLRAVTLPAPAYLSTTLPMMSSPLQTVTSHRLGWLVVPLYAVLVFCCSLLATALTGSGNAGALILVTGGALGCLFAIVSVLLIIYSDEEDIVPKTARRYPCVP